MRSSRRSYETIMWRSPRRTCCGRRAGRRRRRCAPCGASLAGRRMTLRVRTRNGEPRGRSGGACPRGCPWRTGGGGLFVGGTRGRLRRDTLPAGRRLLPAGGHDAARRGRQRDAARRAAAAPGGTRSRTSRRSTAEPTLVKPRARVELVPAADRPPMPPPPPPPRAPAARAAADATTLSRGLTRPPGRLSQA